MSEPLKPKVVAFVPAKGSSERIENKNAKLLDGRPLVVHTLDKLLKCRNVDDVFLDTESDEIAKLARHLPVQRTFFRDSPPSPGPDKDRVAALDAHSRLLLPCLKIDGARVRSQHDELRKSQAGFLGEVLGGIERIRAVAGEAIGY